MEDLTKMNYSTLLDMLAKHTGDYMKMLKNGTSQKEFQDCKNLIDEISIEIESRKQRNECDTG